MINAHQLIKSFVLFAVLSVAAKRCTNYGLLDKLENPGTNTGSAPSAIFDRIFVTNASFAGNLGGIPGADNLCLNDSANPLGAGNGSWKAMLSLAGVRVACTTSDCSGTGLAEHVDWVLKPNTIYRRPDGVQLGATNANGLFAGTLLNSPATSALSVFTGLTSNWTVAGTHCLSWTSNNMVDQGQTGLADQTGILWFSNTSNSCDLPTKRLYCVQQ